MCSESVMELIQTSLREMQIKTTMTYHLTLPRQCDFFILIVSLCTRSPSEPGGPACSVECKWQGSAEESPRVHKGSLLVGVQPVHLLWFLVYKGTASIHQREDNEVRGAGGESFLSLWLMGVQWLWRLCGCTQWWLWWGMPKGHTKQGQRPTNLVSEQERWIRGRGHRRSEVWWGHRRITGTPSPPDQPWEWGPEQSRLWAGGSKSSGSWQLRNEEACKWPGTDPETSLLWGGTLLLPEIQRQRLVWNRQQRKSFACLKERWPAT